jgi:hypothetical protein
MSELTLEHFDETMRAIAETLADHGTTLNEHTKILNEHTKRFDQLDGRLDRIEKHLWDDQRLEEHERRIIKLAERTGSPDLAIPFDRPIGS